MWQPVIDQKSTRNLGCSCSLSESATFFKESKASKARRGRNRWNRLLSVVSVRFTERNGQILSKVDQTLSDSLPLQWQQKRQREVRVHQLPQHTALGRSRSSHRQPTSSLHRQVQDVSSQPPHFYHCSPFVTARKIYEIIQRFTAANILD